MANDGGPAFPVAAPDGFVFAEAGMSLRDWFASQAPVTFSNALTICGWAPDHVPYQDSERTTFWAVMSMLRYEYADAMLAAREKGE